MGYPMSYLEFFGTVAGAVAVWLSARAIVWNWPLGLINVILYFFLFYQVRLYPDMLLQVFFFFTNLAGWWRWTHPHKGEEDQKKELRVSYMRPRNLAAVVVVGLVGTILMGTLADNIHNLFPEIFPEPSAFPYVDSFVTVMSIVTTFLVINKKIEAWIFWIIIDAVATGVYYAKDIRFVALEYLVFCFIAAFGLWRWIREYRSYQTTEASAR